MALDALFQLRTAAFDEMMNLPHGPERDRAAERWQTLKMVTEGIVGDLERKMLGP